MLASLMVKRSKSHINIHNNNNSNNNNNTAAYMTRPKIKVGHGNTCPVCKIWAERRFGETEADTYGQDGGESVRATPPAYNISPRATCSGNQLTCVTITVEHRLSTERKRTPNPLRAGIS